ncbi:hypothetical protein E3J95_02555, partial [Candidatus Aerophobetes bacterium]
MNFEDLKEKAERLMKDIIRKSKGYTDLLTPEEKKGIGQAIVATKKKIDAKAKDKKGLLIAYKALKTAANSFLKRVAVVKKAEKKATPAPEPVSQRSTATSGSGKTVAIVILALSVLILLIVVAGLGIRSEFVLKPKAEEYVAEIATADIKSKEINSLKTEVGDLEKVIAKKDTALNNVISESAKKDTMIDSLAQQSKEMEDIR